MNIILKAFDSRFSKPTLESAFKGKTLGTVISILNDKTEWPDLDAKEHIFISAKDQRAGRYPDVDWNTIAPLDEEIIEQMVHSQAVFLTMIERYERYGDIPYAERKRQYLAHLRYWNHMLEAKKIDLVLMNTPPHQCYDLVLYDLCKLKKIPVYYIERCFIVDAFYLPDTIEDSATEVRDCVEKLQKEYADPAKEIPLSPQYEDVFRKNTEESSNAWYTYNRSERMARRSFLKKWGGIAMELLIRKPRYLIRSVLSADVWRRKWRQHKTSLLYDQLSKEADLSKPYIYLPLHYQPEASTCPMSGVFTDQELMVQLLASMLPPGVALYVKEHHAQEELCRSEEFYRTIHAIPGVTLVPRNSNTFALADSSLAVATGTGTAGFEALLRQKPVLMFGHRFFQYAPGAYPIHTADDCKQALDRIVGKGEKPTRRDARLFLKALEITGTPYAGGPQNPHHPLTMEERAELMGAKIAKTLEPVFSGKN